MSNNNTHMDINFKVPLTMEEAYERKLTVVEIIQSIEIQLIQIKEEVDAGTKDDNPIWRRKTRWALYFKTVEKRRLEAWIFIEKHKMRQEHTLLLQAHKLLRDLDDDKIEFKDEEREVVKQINMYVEE